jgi:hypothetical protein
MGSGRQGTGCGAGVLPRTGRRASRLRGARGAPSARQPVCGAALATGTHRHAVARLELLPAEQRVRAGAAARAACCRAATAVAAAAGPVCALEELARVAGGFQHPVRRRAQGGHDAAEHVVLAGAWWGVCVGGGELRVR